LHTPRDFRFGILDFSFVAALLCCALALEGRRRVNFPFFDEGVASRRDDGVVGNAGKEENVRDMPRFPTTPPGIPGTPSTQKGKPPPLGSIGVGRTYP